MKINMTNILLLAVVAMFLVSCSFFSRQTPKTAPKASPKSPAVSDETKPRSKGETREGRDVPSKAPVHKEAETHRATEKDIPATQQKYYNQGMRFYAQDKFEQAKDAWQTVIKLDRKSDLAEKARENIKKVDQILKRLDEMSGS